MRLQNEARLVLIGRDISSEGMRIEPQADLQPGQVLQLAIYASADEPPIAIRTRVLRNDGPAGVALRFDELSANASRRIEELVAQLPDGRAAPRRRVRRARQRGVARARDRGRDASRAER